MMNNKLYKFLTCALQLFQMFDMKGTQLDGEVRFSKAIRLFRQDLNNYLSPIDVVDSPINNSATSILQVQSFLSNF